jgi:PLP dependent protein
MPYPGLADRLAEIRTRIAEQQRQAGWTHSVTIVAVTKTQPIEAVRATVAVGLLDVGENRVQEALAKQEQQTDLPVRWHLIGSLQRNKARLAVNRFAVIHSVDSLALAQELDRRAAPGSSQPILLQVNCSGEAQKGGVEPEALPALIEAIQPLERLEPTGLMTMAALSEDESVARTAFQRLRVLRDQAEQRGFRLPELSMGMSGDYLVAVEQGATMVRLGTLLFGERDS